MKWLGGTENLPLNVNFYLFLRTFTLLVLMFCLHVCVCSTCVLGACEGKRRSQIPETRVTNSCELLYGYWNLNPGPLHLLATGPPSSPVNVY